VDDLRQKVSYLRGLMEGLDIKDDSKEGKIFNAILEILDDISEEIFEIHTVQEEIEAYLDSMDEDLSDLEEEVYEDSEYEDDELDPDEDYVEVVCPDCGDTVCFEADILDDEDLIEVTCPNCDAVVFTNDEEYDDDIEDDTEEDL